MKKSYYVNKNAQTNGDHEVHCEGCHYIPYPENRMYLGTFISCASAVDLARLTYSTADGCAYCSPDCNTR